MANSCVGVELLQFGHSVSTCKGQCCSRLFITWYSIFLFNFEFVWKLSWFHKALCHAGVTQVIHFIRASNLSYSVNDAKKITESCKGCCKLKLQFHKPPVAHLIKANQPFELLNIDFKGPVPSITNNM